MTINPLAIDTSHWDVPSDFVEIKKAGIVGVICKATEDTTYHDPTYLSQRQRAKAAGLLWGAYHFAHSGNIDAQVSNFIEFAALEAGDCFSLDWEDTNAGTMKKSEAQDFIQKLESNLGRQGQCIIYSGNTAKEALGSSADPFFGARRLWLAQYGSTPHPQASWSAPWLWQYTDGTSGPAPHSVGGWSGDINSYAGSAEQLAAEWATGKAEPVPPVPAGMVILSVPKGTPVKIIET